MIRREARTIKQTEQKSTLTRVKAYTIFKGRLLQLLSKENFSYLYGHSTTTGTSS